MKPWICSTVNLAKAAASGAALNKAGVTWFTFLSVVWADNTTDTNRVKGSW
jgi:hypothetical protein